MVVQVHGSRMEEREVSLHRGLIGAQPEPAANGQRVNRQASREGGFSTGWLIAPSVAWLLLFLVIPLISIFILRLFFLILLATHQVHVFVCFTMCFFIFAVLSLIVIIVVDTIKQYVILDGRSALRAMVRGIDSKLV